MIARPPRRGGFTLLELLVVVAIIAALAALAAGVFFRLQGEQQVRATEATMNKIHSRLQVRWGAVLDDARKTVPADVVTLAGGDKDRALALWTYAKLKSEFPESFAEVGTVATPSTIALSGSTPLVPRRVFTTVSSKTYTTTPTTDEQAAALIYATLSSTGTGGVSSDSDGLNQQATTTPSGLTYWTDTWGQPITFRRWAAPAELQQAPYLHSFAVRTSKGQSFAVNNKFDPTGKLIAVTPNPNWPTWPNVADNPWAATTSRSLALTALGMTDFPNLYAAPTLISYGPNRQAGSDIFGGTSSDAGADNVVSYRLRKEGAKGD